MYLSDVNVCIHGPACVISSTKYLSQPEIITYPVRAKILKIFSTVNTYEAAGVRDFTLAP